jgi:hypothetical protein
VLGDQCEVFSALGSKEKGFKPLDVILLEASKWEQMKRLNVLLQMSVLVTTDWVYYFQDLVGVFLM